MEYKMIEDSRCYDSIELFKKEPKIGDKEIDLESKSYYDSLGITKEDKEFVPYSKKSEPWDHWDPRDEGPSGAMLMLKQFYISHKKLEE